VKRQYANALVLWKPMLTTNPADSAKDDPTTAVTYDLGGIYRPIQYDGTLGIATTTVTLRNGEGAILAPFIAPAAPDTPNRQTASGPGISSTDNTPKQTTPTFTISCESATPVTLLSSSTVPGMGTCASSSVSITSSMLSTNGTYLIKARQTDTSNNVWTDSATLSATLDTVASTYSVNHAVNAGDTETITATFSEPIADTPVSKISLWGQNILSATKMTKASTTVFTCTHTVGSGDGTATADLSVGTDVDGREGSSRHKAAVALTLDLQSQ
jgi:hypothetical protein